MLNNLFGSYDERISAVEDKLDLIISKLDQIIQHFQLMELDPLADIHL